MASFSVNGQIKNFTEPNGNLLDFLRDACGLKSVKDGCSAGACGACTVIVDGAAKRACALKMKIMDGKRVVTAEGLSRWEAEVYAFAFGNAGAVQCGFCTPGMVMSAKALIDQNPSPTASDVKRAIRGNICRCTGYVKIEQAVLSAAEIFKSGVIPQKDDSAKLGANVTRLDAEVKTLGTGAYADDIELPGMVYGKAVRLPVARAKIIAIDASEAKKHPDFVCVVMASDIPGRKQIGHLVRDWDVLFGPGGETRYAGDAVCLVASARKETLNEIAALVRVDYGALPPVTSPEAALAEGAPKLHPKGNVLRRENLKRGDCDAAIQNAAHVVTHRYVLPFTEHAFLEPECAVALPEGDDGVRLYTGGQSVYDEQREVSEMLNLPREKVHVTSMLVGGAFGGKEDMSVQHHAALLAWLVKRPVKVRLSRPESLLVHPKRHAMTIDMTSACDADGNLLAVKAKIISDTGAYASLGGPVLQRACTHAAGPYHIENIDIEGVAVYTNNPPAGAFRGFGVPQSAFASECNLNLLAEKAGISPWEIRFKNAVRPGEALPNGQIADDSTNLTDCLLALKSIYEASPCAGIAASLKNCGAGTGLPDMGRCVISVEGGKVRLRSSAACIGQGMATVMMQMAAEATNLPADVFIVEPPDTARTPDSGTTTASRQTMFTGEAVRVAAVKLAEALKENPLSALEGREFYGEYMGVTDPIGSDKPNPVSHVAYGYAAQVVVLDENGRLQKVAAAYDAGRIVNPKSAEGQIEGGVVMGLGYALTEDFPLDNGIPTAKFGTLGLFRATDVPPIETTLIERESKQAVAYGAKGVGELATIPTASAVQHAYYRLDGKFRKTLPLTETPYDRKRGEGLC